MKNMKKKILCLSFVCVLLMMAMLVTGCGTDELEAKIDENATKAETAVNDAATKAADDLAAAKSALEALVAKGDAANTEALTAAIAQLNTAIDTAKQAATTADTAMKAELETSIADAIESASDAVSALETALNAKIATLSATLETKTAALDAALATLQTNTATNATNVAAVKQQADTLKTEVNAIKADIVSVKGSIATINSTLTTLGTDVSSLNQSVAALEERMNAADISIAATYVKITDWNDATDDVIENVINLIDAYNDVYNAPYYSTLPVNVQQKVVAVYTETYVKLFRATNETAADSAWAFAKDVLTGIDGIVALYNTYDLSNYYTNEANAMVGYYNAALAKIPTLVEGGDETAAEVKDDLAKKLADVLTKAEIDAATAINDRVAALSTALDATYGYNATNKAEYESIMAAIEAWNELVGADAEQKINLAAVEALTTKYEALVTAYNNAAAALKARLDEVNAADYVFNYSATNYDAIIDLYNDVTAWVDEVENQRSFTSTGEVEAPVYAAIATFNANTYVRAGALHTANTEAISINGLIESLTTDITNMTVIKSEYKIRYDAIVSAVTTWDATYFGGAYADEKVIGNNNYDLLDHEAYNALVTLYNTEIKPVIDSAKDVADLISAVGAPADVTLSDYEAIMAAFDKYAEFTNKLGDLSYDLEDVDGIGIYGRPGVMTSILAELLAAYDARLADAATNYATLTVLTKDDVTVYTDTEVNALVAWYNTYLGLNIASDATVYPEGKEYVLSATLKITKAEFDAACEAYNAYNTLVEAKAAFYTEIETEINAIVNASACTNQREAITAAYALLTSWENGSNAPDGFVAAQFASDASEVATLKAALDTHDADVVDLENRRDAIIARIEALENNYETLADDALRATTAAEIESLMGDGVNAGDIADLIADNADFDCFAQAHYDAIAAAELAVEKAQRISDITDKYDLVVAQIATISDEYVKTSLTTRVNASLAEAKAAIAAIQNVNDASDVTLAEADFELVAHIVDTYVANPSGFGADIMKARYQLLEAREPMTNAAQLATEKTFVTETFTNITAP